MNIKGEKEFKVEKGFLYEQLLDPEVLKSCIPGCKALDKTTDTHYDAELELGIAAIKGRYTGSVELENLNAPDTYTMVVSGSGSPGFMNAKLNFELEQIDETQTILRYSGEADVGGKIAAIGQRMLGGVVKLITNQFFGSMVKEVQRQVGA